MSDLKVHAEERILELAKPDRGLISNIPAPRLVIANSAFRAKFYPEAQTVPAELSGEVNEGVPCLVWTHTRGELRTYARLRPRFSRNSPFNRKTRCTVQCSE